MRRQSLIFMLAAFCASSPARADREAANEPVVFAGEHNNCFAKSVPYGPYGSAGRTDVFTVDNGGGRVIARYDWYSRNIYLDCRGSGRETGVDWVIQYGPWARGQRASAHDLAIAFYDQDKLVRQYSTLDLAGKEDNVAASVSHYEVIAETLGVRWNEGGHYVLSVRTHDGRVLSFDAKTGRQIASDDRPCKAAAMIGFAAVFLLFFLGRESGLIVA